MWLGTCTSTSGPLNPRKRPQLVMAPLARFLRNAFALRASIVASASYVACRSAKSFCLPLTDVLIQRIAIGKGSLDCLRDNRSYREREPVGLGFAHPQQGVDIAKAGRRDRDMPQGLGAADLTAEEAQISLSIDQSSETVRAPWRDPSRGSARHNA